MIADQFRTTFAGARDRVRRALRAALRRRLRPAVADRPDRPRRDRHRDRRPAAGQEGPGAGDAVGRRAGADRGRAAVRDARGPAGPVLRPRRGRRRARRGEHRPVRGGACGASPTRPSSSSSPTTAARSRRPTRSTASPSATTRSAASSASGSTRRRPLAAQRAGTPTRGRVGFAMPFWRRNGDDEPATTARSTNRSTRR